MERNGRPREKEPPTKPGWAEPRTTARSWCGVNHPGHHAEQGTWGSHTRKHREAGCGRPEDGGVCTAKTVKRPPQRPPQQPAQPQYANYWAPLTRKRHIRPPPAQPRHTNYWAPRTRTRHQQGHRPQRPTESSDLTQHAKGRPGDCPGPRKGTTTRRNVTQGGGGMWQASLPLTGPHRSNPRRWALPRRRFSTVLPPPTPSGRPSWDGQHLVPKDGRPGPSAVRRRGCGGSGSSF